MTTIRLTTIIKAPIDRCFDLSRSIDLHLDSMRESGETVIDGRSSGLMEKGETVTWRATHFFISQIMKVSITAMERPAFFEDKMVMGPFKSMAHTHHFLYSDGYTTMTDCFEYEVPYLWIGTIFNSIVLKSYMTRLLEHRNETIKKFAEVV